MHTQTARFIQMHSGKMRMFEYEHRRQRMMHEVPGSVSSRWLESDQRTFQWCLQRQGVEGWLITVVYAVCEGLRNVLCARTDASELFDIKAACAILSLLDQCAHFEPSQGLRLMGRRQDQTQSNQWDRLIFWELRCKMHLYPAVMNSWVLNVKYGYISNHICNQV